MSAVIQGLPAPLSGEWVWTGRILSGFIVLFLLFLSGVIKLMPILGGHRDVPADGLPIKYALLIGIVELICVVPVHRPGTAVLARFC